MKFATTLLSTLLLMASAARAEEWHFKKQFLQTLVKDVPGILKGEDKKTGRFGQGIWIVTDQNAMYPLAVAWATKIDGVENPYYHNDDLLQAIMLAGDALIADQHPDGQWEFRKKDGSTWGDIYMPWTYSRWIRSFALIRDGMPADRRAKWEKALTLGMQGIYETELKKPMQNIPAHNAMGLYLASKLFDRKDWQDGAVDYLHRCCAAQYSDGYWTEHSGPVVMYNGVYVDLLGAYYGMSHDPVVLPVLERSAHFHAAMMYPDGRAVETVDERNPYNENIVGINIGFCFCPEGRAHVMRQREKMSHYTEHPVGAEAAASFILYGEEGEVAPPVAKGAMYVSGDQQVMTRNDSPWFLVMTSYHAEISTSRWIQDRQNFVSLYHDGLHVILGGGNTKLQPLWSTFTVGDPALLFHKPGDENPDFLPPPGIMHVPTDAKLDPSKNSLDLDYDGVKCNVTADTSDPKQAKIVYSLVTPTDKRVEAHVPLLITMKKPWSTASGKSGVLSENQAFKFGPGETGDWLAHRGWKISVPPTASITWPAMPHTPYTKDGRADPMDWRIVITLPLDKDHMRYEITLQADEKEAK